MIEITEKMDLNGTINDDVLLKNRADVKIYGIVNGDIHALQGSKLTVSGEVNGSIVATDATLNLNPGARITQGFSWIGDYGNGPKVRTGHDIQSDDVHLKKAIAKHYQLLNPNPDNRA